MIFFSTFMYALAKRMGTGFREAWGRELNLGPRSNFGSVRTLAALSASENIVTAVSGACLIGPARSMMAGRFLSSDADVWVTCDDDTCVDSPQDLRSLVRACRDLRAMIAVPSIQRDIRYETRTQESPGWINVRLLEDDKPEITLGTGYKVARIRRMGFGLVALHRECVQRMREAFPELEFTDQESQVDYPGLFYERLKDKHWLGEDTSFCERARETGLELYAMLDVECEHEGRRMILELDHESKLAMRLFDLENP